ncbi:MAG: GNAT family N-acetyltransferase [Candidatus Devosia euplotis]|nr:GNAT family N-acetyltransferase [Candidatus Devosia euplotis]
MSEIILRPFQRANVPAITAIYQHYVEHSVATFDLQAPGEDVLGEKFGHMLAAGHPIVMAQAPDSTLLGYAYASVYRPRPAYRFTCENSVYCAPDAIGKGLGTLLMNEIITQSRSYGFKQMIAVITAEGTGSIKLLRHRATASLGTIASFSPALRAIEPQGRRGAFKRRPVKARRRNCTLESCQHGLAHAGKTERGVDIVERDPGAGCAAQTTTCPARRQGHRRRCRDLPCRAL